MNKKHLLEIGSRELFFWAALAVLVAFWLHVLVGTAPGEVLNPDAAIERVLQNGAFDVLAWALVAMRMGSIGASRPASRWQIGTAVLVSLLALIPYRLATAAALVILGGRLLSDAQIRPQGRQVAWLWLALALESLWLSGLLSPLHVMVGALDASLVAAVYRGLGLAATVDSNVVNNVSADFSIIIWPYCSSSHPLAGVSLGYLATAIYLDRPSRRPRWIWLGAAFLCSVVLTEIRLILLARNQASYDWWHDGPGVAVYTLTALAFTVAFPILASRHPVAAGAAIQSGRGE